jgi:K+-transporting ATPase KdpF subunit
MMLAVAWQDATGLVFAVLAVVYLVVVLIFPERF